MRIENPAQQAYKVYTALLNQAGTGAPVATVLQNTLGGAVVWSRDSAGAYFGTLAGAFPANKTAIVQGSATPQGGQFAGVGMRRVTDNDITVECFDADLTVPEAPFSDDLLVDTFIEVRVYP